MAINFPNAPNVGDSFTSGGRVWQWDGTKWIPASTSGTGFLPLNGGTLTGPLLLASDPVAALGAATKEYVDASGAVGPTAFGGFINKLRNGAFDIWQRGAVSATTGTAPYTADGWIVAPVGATATIGGGGSPRLGASPNGPTSFVLQITGAAGMTACSFVQRVESFLAANLVGQNCTFQVWFYNGSAASFAPSLQIVAANALDNWTGGTSVVLPPTPLQSCPAGQWTRLAYTFAASAAIGYGLQASIVLGAVLGAAGAFVRLSEADLRATPGLPVGLCANPPPPELRPIGIELPLCYRYFREWDGPQVIGSGYFASATLGATAVGFGVQMRAAPTITASSGAALISSGLPSTSIVIAAVGRDAFQLNTTITGAGAGNGLTTTIANGAFIRATAEL